MAHNAEYWEGRARHYEQMAANARVRAKRADERLYASATARGKREYAKYKRRGVYGRRGAVALSSVARAYESRRKRRTTYKRRRNVSRYGGLGGRRAFLGTYLTRRRSR